jgi:hypothetical protein
MERQKLREVLEQLHHELKGTRSVDESGRELLCLLMDDIQQILDQSGEDKAQPNQNLTDQLTRAIYYFDTTHPTLALSMKRVIDTLSNMGI